MVPLECEGKQYRRETGTVPLAVHVTTRPHAGDQDEPIPRRELLSDVKIQAEGTPDEEQIVLGWELDTRLLQIKLPSDKFIAWSADLSEVMSTERILQSQLESTIGRLSHAAFIIPLSRHFLFHLRSLIDYERTDRRRTVKISKEAKEELDVWRTFLEVARNGISLNLMTLRKPTQLAISDSCPYGMGGFTWSGRAWRLRIPEESPIFGVDEANNVLEFLAMAVTLKLLLIECREKALSEECLLSLGDNTSAIGWMFRISGVKRSSWYFKSVFMISREVAKEISESGHCLFAQHLKGAKNVIAVNGLAKGENDPGQTDNHWSVSHGECIFLPEHAGSPPARQDMVEVNDLVGVEAK